MTGQPSAMTYPREVADRTTDDVTGDLAALLTRALGAARVTAAADTTGPIGALLAALTRLGWAAGPAGLLSVVRAGTPLPDGSAVVVVLHDQPHDQRPWPGWDDAVIAAGYVGCARADRWTWYVHDERAAELGPGLGSLAVGSAALVDEVIAWRTAALARWATRADDESGRANKELKAEVHTAKARLAEMETSLTWKLGRGLRILVPSRLVRALRR